MASATTKAKTLSTAKSPAAPGTAASRTPATKAASPKTANPKTMTTKDQAIDPKLVRELAKLLAETDLSEI